MEKKLISITETKFASTDDDTMSFTGYGAVFGNTDDYGDVIAKGAFAKSIKDGAKPLMFLNHNPMALPIGKWTGLEEDDFGLKVEGKFIDTSMGRDAHVASKSGAITGLSIGYIPKEIKFGKPGTNEPARLIKSIELLEISVVTFPANTKARILDVKSISDEAGFELHLTTLGMTLEEAKMFLTAHASQCETKYNDAAVNVAARNLLMKLQGE